jgi:hypothetical protein
MAFTVTLVTNFDKDYAALATSVQTALNALAGGSTVVDVVPLPMPSTEIGVLIVSHT